jgi:hypothetical protein
MTQPRRPRLELQNREKLKFRISAVPHYGGQLFNFTQTTTTGTERSPISRQIFQCLTNFMLLYFPNFGRKKLEGRNHLEDLRVDGKIILQCMLRK